MYTLDLCAFLKKAPHRRKAEFISGSARGPYQKQRGKKTTTNQSGFSIKFQKCKIGVVRKNLNLLLEGIKTEIRVALNRSIFIAVHGIFFRPYPRGRILRSFEDFHFLLFLPKTKVNSSRNKRRPHRVRHRSTINSGAPFSTISTRPTGHPYLHKCAAKQTRRDRGK